MEEVKALIAVSVINNILSYVMIAEGPEAIVLTPRSCRAARPTARQVNAIESIRQVGRPVLKCQTNWMCPKLRPLTSHPNRSS